MEDDELEVDLDEEDESDELEVDLDEVDDTDEDKKRKDNKAFAAMRIENKRLKEENERLSVKPDPIIEPEPAPDPNDVSNWTEKQWDELAEKDWKQAVDLRSQMNAKNVMQEQTKIEKSNKVLVDSKQKVLTRHPELNDVNSEKSKIFKQIPS